ncbi:MAG: carbohydrate ABC transporter permease, partial [Dictyoglomaceae bacterium]|nr:carbohydrate ABC transporter permease [Dictyoglomaceae bacterium]
MRLGKKERDFIYYLLLTLFGYIMLYPLLWLLGSSFKEHSEIFANITSLIPKEFTWNNYIEGWKGFGGISFTIFFKNSFIVAILETLGVIFSSTIIAYGFARISFPG